MSSRLELSSSTYCQNQRPLSLQLQEERHSEQHVMRPTFFIDNLEVSTNSSSQAESGGQATIHSFYNCSSDDPNFNGLFTAYGPQPQVVGFSTARLPLPFDFADDNGLIFVNAKQYHGILRRRQVRAKLVAQNRLLKTRKPYMHESRHLHAVNRVRGSGGRFLSSKKVQHHYDSPSSSANSTSAIINLVEASMSTIAP